ncbi:MAG: hypothetical protein EXR95_02295 [Gemmatimonadetes bacterium]|nr:hypothetical protein [Gemmatimonadota bacterium]
MILPTVRASFGRRDALHLVDLLARRDPELRDAARARLEQDGPDSLLDDPRVRNALLTDPDVQAPPALVFYVLVRQALLEGGVDSPATADFVASLVIAFGRSDRAYRISDDTDEEFHYLVDMIEQMRTAEERRAFLLRAHLGNHALWLAGLFPDYLEARERRRGAPPIDYYDRMGRTGYQLASESPQAVALGVDKVFGEVARNFTAARTSLNQLSDRYLWPGGGYPVNRLLREVSHHSDR